METGSYALVVTSRASFDATVETVRQALTEQGFGVLCEIDVSATLKKKLDADYPRTLILGACNPPLALRALTAVPDISVFLPCNVVVRMRGDQVEVAAIKPKLRVTTSRITLTPGEKSELLRIDAECVA